MHYRENETACDFQTKALESAKKRTNKKGGGEGGKKGEMRESSSHSRIMISLRRFLVSKNVLKKKAKEEKNKKKRTKKTKKDCVRKINSLQHIFKSNATRDKCN